MDIRIGVDAVACGGADDGSDAGEEVCAPIGSEPAGHISISGGRPKFAFGEVAREVCTGGLSSDKSSHLCWWARQTCHRSAWLTATSAAAHDGAQLANVLEPANTASDVWADTAYRSKTNEAHLAKHGQRSKIHFGRQPGHDLTPAQRKANRARSKVRSAVETVFAGQKHRFGLFVRTIGLARARTKIGLANLAYNLKRFLWIEIRPAMA